VDREVRGAENASDHAPAWVVVRNASGRAEPKQRMGQAAPPDRRPLLLIDGDSFAHRSYHALPKTILRRGISSLTASMSLRRIDKLCHPGEIGKYLRGKQNA
jgi:hypothetical protein